VSADRALQIGRAAEHLVVADLLLAGHEACLTEAGMPYDVIADVHGRLLRIQVKATGKPKNVNSQGRTPRLSYAWNIRTCGKGGRRKMSDADCDLVALVALDIRAVAYLPIAKVGQTAYLDAPGSSGVRMTKAGERFKKATWPGNVTEYPLEAALALDK